MRNEYGIDKQNTSATIKNPQNGAIKIVNRTESNEDDRSCHYFYPAGNHCAAALAVTLQGDIVVRVFPLRIMTTPPRLLHRHLGLSTHAAIVGRVRCRLHHLKVWRCHVHLLDGNLLQIFNTLNLPCRSAHEFAVSAISSQNAHSSCSTNASFLSR